MGDPAHVLCVCTANVCRSPAAALLLRAGLRARLGAAAGAEIVVASAGTWASPDRPVEPGTADALRRAGVPPADVAAARSTRLTPEAWPAPTCSSGRPRSTSGRCGGSSSPPGTAPSPSASWSG
jgi:protein-tyrosine phosphatase